MFRWLKRSGKSRTSADPAADRHPTAAEPWDEAAGGLPDLRNPRLFASVEPVEPEEPARFPAPQRRAHPRPSSGEHGTRPLTLLSELCAKFQDATEPGSARGGDRGGVPGWTLTLEVAVGARGFQRTVFGETLIGRRDIAAGHVPDVDLFEDDTVSRRHARIYVRNGRYRLQDLDSMNGTRHNGEWLSPGGEAVLEQGDEIALGELCRLRVVDPLLESGDAGLTDLLQLALGGMVFADQEHGPLAHPSSDVLDLALERGSASGLLGD